MVKNYEQFEKSLWPKVATWEIGQDTQHILGSMLRSFYDQVKDSINLGYITKIVRTSYSPTDRDMDLTLSDGTTHHLELRQVPKYGFTPEAKWREKIGLKKLIDDQSNKIQIVDWDYVMCLPGYIKMIEDWEFIDITTENNKKNGILIMERKRMDVNKHRDWNTETQLYGHYYMTEEEHLYQYKFYTSGKVVMIIRNFYNNPDGPQGEKGDYVQILQRMSPMNGDWKEFEKLFQLVLKKEEKMEQEAKLIRDSF